MLIHSYTYIHPYSLSHTHTLSLSLSLSFSFSLSLFLPFSVSLALSQHGSATQNALADAFSDTARKHTIQEHNRHKHTLVDGNACCRTPQSRL